MRSHSARKLLRDNAQLGRRPDLRGWQLLYNTREMMNCVALRSPSPTIRTWTRIERQLGPRLGLPIQIGTSAFDTAQFQSGVPIRPIRTPAVLIRTSDSDRAGIRSSSSAHSNANNPAFFRQSPAIRVHVYRACVCMMHKHKPRGVAYGESGSIHIHIDNICRHAHAHAR